MCIPKPAPAPSPQSTQVQYIQPPILPAMQAANALELGNGNVPRGAAQLGRLQLRFGRQTSASQGSTAQASGATSSSAVAGATAPAATPASSGNQAIAADVGGVGTFPGSTAGLRFGNFNDAYIP